MRHVANIIASAIWDEAFVPWALVHAKASLRGTMSNLSDVNALAGEQRVRIPCSQSIDAQKPRQSKVCVNFIMESNIDTLVTFAPGRLNWHPAATATR